MDQMDKLDTELTDWVSSARLQLSAHLPAMLIAVSAH